MWILFFGFLCRDCFPLVQFLIVKYIWVVSLIKRRKSVRCRGAFFNPNWKFLIRTESAQFLSLKGNIVIQIHYMARWPSLLYIKVGINPWRRVPALWQKYNRVLQVLKCTHGLHPMVPMTALICWSIIFLNFLQVTINTLSPSKFHYLNISFNIV